MITPRMRMFAGPNGSGKSTIKGKLPDKILGIYVNPDDIEKELRNTGQLKLQNYRIITSVTDFSDYLKKSTLLQNTGLLKMAHQISCEDGVIKLYKTQVNSYFASVIAGYIREKLLEGKISFTFETVMSSPDKIDFLAKARKSGFRNYLYYIATEGPEINISRVNNRVMSGGHPVPVEKIISRYYRSLNLLPQAVNNTDRAYIFDNSGEESILLAEVENGTDLKYCTEMLPYWFASSLVGG